ncbi:MAG: transporter substrate-binding domain-containing protein [Natronohydrobacter sp.]|nr:transporter substrate-binding domain-containing protein [Natronohydrobacter sp.]
MRLRTSLSALVLMTVLTLAGSGLFAREFPSDDSGRDRVGIDYDAIMERGYIEIGVYEDFAPYSWRDTSGQLVGVDVALARLIADELGVDLRLIDLPADEDVDTDLRNYIWRGHYMGRRIVNVLMRVPYNRELDYRNELAALTGRYAQERIAIAYRVSEYPDEPPWPGSFTVKTVAVENHSLADFYLTGLQQGALIRNMTRRRTLPETIDLLRAGEVSAVMGIRARLEHYVRDDPDFAVESGPLPGLSIGSWPIGIATAFYTARMLSYEVDDILTAAVRDGRVAAIYREHGLTWEEPGR